MLYRYQSVDIRINEYNSIYMIILYTIRLIVQQIGNIDLHMSCTDNNSNNDDEETKTTLILPWIMGNFTRTYWNTYTNNNYNYNDNNNYTTTK